MTRRLATKNIILIIAGVLVVTGAASTGALYAYWDQAVPLAGMAIDYVRFLSRASRNPGNRMAASKDAEPLAASGAPAPGPMPAAPPVADQTPGAATGNWPSYNKTLTSERYSPAQPDQYEECRQAEGLCTYDIDQYAGFESGLIMVDGALIGTTQFDIFSLEPGDLRRELANARGLPPATLLARQPRRRLHGRHAVSRHPGRARAGL